MDNNDHQHFGVVLDGLKDDQFTLNEGQPITADIIAVGLMKSIDIGVREGVCMVSRFSRSLVSGS